MRDIHAWLQSRMAAMPPVRMMQIGLADIGDDDLSLSAPLAANLNDKDSAFGGSLVALMTLAGWALASAQLLRAGFEADVYVADSEVKYLHPVKTDLRARATAPSPQALQAFIDTFAARGKARIRLQVCIALAEGGPACTLSGRYVALRREPAANGKT
ncbi:MAG: YiiD C-terminal domain-containing protein [Pseudomonadota bacterium]|nr:YiiD C-terminal domain-containing protein [Pseudomonadota bacterium]